MESTINQHPSAAVNFYHGTRREFAPGSLINPKGEHAYLTANLDAAIWAAELSEGDEPAKVYVVIAPGSLENTAEHGDFVPTPYPQMTLRTSEPLRVLKEVTTWNHYHGTRANLRPGDLIEPGHGANFGPAPRAANYVYFTRTLDASVWGAELATGEGRGRIYLVEPTGPVEDDPNLSNARFKGNPTQSFRSRAPLRVVEELLNWEGHPPDVIAQMKEGLARLSERGVGPLDD